jgi:hypothetical protein
MPEFDKVPCADCGEMVSIHHKSQEAHAKKCKGKSEMNETKVVEKQVVKKEQEIDVEGLDQEAAELYRVAKRARETRKESPEIYVAGMSTDERKELVKRYAPDCVDPRYNPNDGKPRRYAPMHAMFVPKAKAGIYAHRAYEPVFNEHRKIVEHEGDLLFKIPRDMWMAGINADSAESKKWREATIDDKSQKLQNVEDASYEATRSTKQVELTG